MQNFKTEIKWALIFIAVLLLWMIMERVLGFHSDNIEYHFVVSMLFPIPAIIIYILALRAKREHYYGGQMNYGQGFKSGLILTLIITLLSPLAQYIISEIISPDYFRNMIEYTVNAGEKTQQEAEAVFNLSSYLWQSTIFTLVMGVVTTAIVALFVRGKQADEE